MRVLNLYCGIGGNRKLWKSDWEVVAIENNPEIARVYKSFFPQDTVIVCDAHQYLLEHFKEFDFIWSSPPCQSHSQIRFNLGVKNRGTKPVYPDLTLYEEILLLKWYYSGKWVVENTKAFYSPLVTPYVAGGHFFWSSDFIPPFDMKDRDHRTGTVESLQKKKMLSLDGFDIINKRQILRNCVEPELAQHVTESVVTPKTLL